MANTEEETTENSLNLPCFIGREKLSRLVRKTEVFSQLCLMAPAAAGDSHGIFEKAGGSPGSCIFMGTRLPFPFKFQHLTTTNRAWQPGFINDTWTARVQRHLTKIETISIRFDFSDARGFCCLLQFRIPSSSFAHANCKVLLVELNARQSESENAYDKRLQTTNHPPS